MKIEGGRQQAPTIRIAQNMILLTLFGVVAILVFLHLSVKFCDGRDICGVWTDFSLKWGSTFDVTKEGNIPT